MSITGYGLTQFEKDIQKIRPRFFDTHILPPFMLWFAMKSRAMGRWPRRALFTAGIYMLYRNYSDYKKGYTAAMMYAKNLTTPQTATVETIT